jgi:hypothetical protein
MRLYVLEFQRVDYYVLADTVQQAVAKLVQHRELPHELAEPPLLIQIEDVIV